MEVVCLHTVIPLPPELSDKFSASSAEDCRVCLGHSAFYEYPKAISKKADDSLAANFGPGFLALLSWPWQAT